MSTSTITEPLVEEVEGYNTDALITYLQGKAHLEINETEFQSLRNERVNGYNFLRLNNELLKDCGIRVGQRALLIELISNLNSQKQPSVVELPTKRPRLLRDLDEKYEEKESIIWSNQSEETKKALFEDNPNIVTNGDYALGQSDFVKFITSSIFVDKSLFIMEFMIYGKQANLITRPHQFGKTTNLSMLYAFLAPPSTEEEKTQRLSLSKDLRIYKYE
ncbi:AAA family ATPase [Rhizophagus clarus]|uniref:AAA family ATPase n=1 Tax=Rhizophagus clarus TaxID=94130 RepID=A0A8H3MHW8_9GLOM|nr:AAA family ATPase [Rhizophagus clarus]